jgi:hypothetical protein
VGGVSLFLELDLCSAGLRFHCGVLHNKKIAANIIVSLLNLLIHLHVWENGKSTAIAIELYVQWDPGIIENVLMAAMFIQLAQKSADLHVLYANVLMQTQWNPGDWCSLQFFDQGLQYLLGFYELWCWHDSKHERNEKRNVGYAIFGLIRNSDVLLICTSLWPTEMQMDMDFTAANNLSLVLCHLLNAALKVGHAYEMEELLETLFVVTLPHASVSRMHTAKYDFLMWPSKHVQMPWDPGDVHNNTISARLTQCIVCLCLERPWDPGIIVIHKPTVPDDLSAEVGATKCCNLIKPLLGDKQCFLGAVMSYPYMYAYSPDGSGPNWTWIDGPR